MVILLRVYNIIPITISITSAVIPTDRNDIFEKCLVKSNSITTYIHYVSYVTIGIILRVY